MTYSVVINDLGDNGNVTSGRSVVDENNSTDLDESLESGWLLGLDISSLCLFTAVQLVGQAEQLQSVSFSPSFEQPRHDILACRPCPDGPSHPYPPNTFIPSTLFSSFNSFSHSIPISIHLPWTEAALPCPACEPVYDLQPLYRYPTT